MNHYLQENQKLVTACTQQFKKSGFDETTQKQFVQAIYHYYKSQRRSFSWREQISPYRIVVSEVMLQQTQTDRVAKKFEPFIQAFPSFQALAQADFQDVLRYWKGLGYNRRALAIQTIAQRVVNEHGGKLPNCPATLETFRGIGPATASSICAFAFDAPTIFIETNIRTVFIYFFFQNQDAVSDKDILPLIEKSLDAAAPREWYYALMDYGVMLKKTVGNLCRMSKHYTKQSKFEGSDRQIRGMILQQLLDTPGMPVRDLLALLDEQGKKPERVARLLEDLCVEGFVQERGGALLLGKQQ